MANGASQANTTLVTVLGRSKMLRRREQTDVFAGARLAMVHVTMIPHRHPVDAFAVWQVPSSLLSVNKVGWQLNSKPRAPKIHSPKLT